MGSNYVEVYDRETIDALVRNRMAQQLAEEIVVTIPTEVTLRNDGSALNHKGIPSEVHKMTMFIFSEQELRERDEDLRRQVRFDLATERALNMMSGRVQH